MGNPTIQEIRGSFVSIWGISETCLSNFLKKEIDEWGSDQVDQLRQLYLDFQTGAIDPNEFALQYSGAEVIEPSG